MTDQPESQPEDTRQHMPAGGVADGGLPARRAAYAILNDILFQKRNMDEAFARAPSLEDMAGRDKAFVRLLVATVLKHGHEMDEMLAQLLHQPLKDLKPQQLINIFRLGFAQAIFLQTPPHAAVNTTVDLAEAEGIAHHKPLVNAIMRRITRDALQPMPPRDAGRFNTPAWLWNEWMRDYGVETALDIAAANLGEGAIDFSVKGDPADWADKLEADVLPTGALRKIASGFIPDLPGFAEGDWWVQNAAAAIPARLFGDIKDKTVVDLCAAPGGKTAQLATLGAIVTAVDRSAERIRRLDENIQRLKLVVATAVADGAVWKPSAPVDAVLIDAPCTATGTIRHQPDVLWLKDIRDQEKLAGLQRRLLVNALDMLKPGGVMIYCTCSLQKAEGEDQATWLLQQNLPVRIKPITEADMPGLDGLLTTRGELRCLPQHWQVLGGLDGFYAVRFEKLA
ncbi:MAG: RsmB/NOP family class I SAM-dependent RNA methyltransferase [Micavibrio sp.]|nr:RsmB/NOP family class I SAM-dependent RNA methyltransferase [Micavibrio sp.]